MDLQQPGEVTQPGRTESFYDGVQGTPSMTASGLAEESAMFNSKVPGKFTPHSVLQGISGTSGNGMSDTSRFLPNGQLLPSQNGSSEESYQATQQMRFMANRGV